ncbi:MAG: hypothetical protein HYX40_13035 [Sphingobacteriales bacterium]|nr:hypothetical protein [Sphingobacteriales bacterium]
MKKFFMLTGVCLFFVSVYFLFYIHIQPHLFVYLNQQEEQLFEEKESAADKQMEMWFQARAYPDPNNLNEKYKKAWKQFQQFKNINNNAALGIAGTASAANWTSLGPSVTIGGRILCIAVDPANSNNLWAGSASGGIWKSINGGSSWVPVITNLPVLGVSSIIIDPYNSKIIYAGTGEVYRVDTSNTGFNVWKTRGTYGIGIIKSIDGGVTWSQVLNKKTPEMFGIQMLEFDPTNNNIIYACATDGLYKSADAGDNWSKILNKTYVTDVAINPSNTNQIVVGVGNMVNADKGIYRCTDGNSATPGWTKITSGLPASFNGFIRLDNAGSTRLVASIGRNDNSTLNEIYMSTNFGTSWIAKNSSHHCQYQYWFSHDVAINPSNLNQFVMGGVSLYRYSSNSTTSGNGTRSTIGSNVHSDIHDVKFDPNNSNVIYIACDGGIYKSTNGGTSFSSINNGLAATQFYASFATHPTDPNIMIGGLQDNGVVRFNGSTWSTAFGGDGGPCLIAPNGTTILASNDAKSVRRSTTGVTGSFSSVMSSWAFSADDRTAFMAPVAISKSNPNYMYCASDNMHISTNAGGSWTNTSFSSATNYIEQQHKTGIALAVSPLNQNKIYVSTSPFAQNTTNDFLWVTGQPNVFKSTNPFSVPYPSIKGTLPDRFVMDFAISPTNDDSVFVVLGGFGTSHIYVTGNGGDNWTSIGTGLPDIPFNAILIDPVDPQILYAGCDFGVYVSPDRGNTWIDYNNGFWDATLVMDLQATADNKIIAATHGKGVFKSDRYSGLTAPVVVTFTGFNSGEINTLELTSQHETDLKYYELEKSTDGIHFTTIARDAASNQGYINRYKNFDKAAINTSAIYYYRTKLVNTDGSSRYTQVIALEVPGVKSFSILSNPFRDQIKVEVRLVNAGQVVLTLYNSSGLLIKKQLFRGSDGPNILSLEGLGDLSNGIYILETVIDNKRSSLQVMKN